MTSNTKKSIQKTVNKDKRKLLRRNIKTMYQYLRITTLQVLKKRFLLISRRLMNFMLDLSTFLLKLFGTRTDLITSYHF